MEEFKEDQNEEPKNVKTFKRAFDIPLDDAQLADTAHQMSEKLKRIDALEEAYNRAKEAKKATSGLLEEVMELGRFIEKGCESTMVDCYYLYDVPEEGKKTIIRADTKEEVEILDMTDAEKQGDFFVDPGGNPKEGSEQGDLTLPDKEGEGGPKSDDENDDENKEKPGK